MFTERYEPYEKIEQDPRSEQLKQMRATKRFLNNLAQVNESFDGETSLPQIVSKWTDKQNRDHEITITFRRDNQNPGENDTYVFTHRVKLSDHHHDNMRNYDGDKQLIPFILEEIRVGFNADGEMVFAKNDNYEAYNQINSGMDVQQVYQNLNLISASDRADFEDFQAMGFEKIPDQKNQILFIQRDVLGKMRGKNTENFEKRNFDEIYRDNQFDLAYPDNVTNKKLNTDYEE